MERFDSAKQLDLPLWIEQKKSLHRVIHFLRLFFLPLLDSVLVVTCVLHFAPLLSLQNHVFLLLLFVLIKLSFFLASFRMKHTLLVFKEIDWFLQKYARERD